MDNSVVTIMRGIWPNRKAEKDQLMQTIVECLPAIS